MNLLVGAINRMVEGEPRRGWPECPDALHLVLSIYPGLCCNNVGEIWPPLYGETTRTSKVKMDDDAVSWIMASKLAPDTWKYRKKYHIAYHAFCCVSYHILLPILYQHIISCCIIACRDIASMVSVLRYYYCHMILYHIIWCRVRLYP